MVKVISPTGFRIVDCGQPWVAFILGIRCCERHLDMQVRVARLGHRKGAWV